MPFWRRDKEPPHERRSREGGTPFDDEFPPHDTRPRWGSAGIHGIHRFREWDALVRVEGVELETDEVGFVALADGTLVVPDDVDEGELMPFAEAVEAELPPPFRAQAVHGGGGAWTVAAEAIELAELGREVEGEQIELTVREGERSLIVDGALAFGSIPSLERLGEARGDDFVVRASRVDGDLWDVRVLPL
jgi:hypothetical protein